MGKFITEKPLLFAIGVTVFGGLVEVLASSVGELAEFPEPVLILIALLVSVAISLRFIALHGWWKDSGSVATIQDGSVLTAPLLVAFTFLPFLGTFALVLGGPTPPQVPGTSAFVDVNVIPMDTKRVLENQIVVVEDERITAIGLVNEVTVPVGAEVIEGNGAYLMPGLADMHMHFTSIDQTFTGPGQLQVYLAEGVTTVRNYTGTPENLDWRDEVARGERVGPSIYTSGPVIVGVFDPTMHLGFWATVILLPVGLGLVVWLLIWGGLKLTKKEAQFCQIRRYALPGLAVLLLIGWTSAWLKIVPLASPAPFAIFPETAARARQGVRDQAVAGYDFIKVYDYLSEETYLAAVDEAKKQNIYVVGHLLDTLSPQTIFSSGLREVAHLDEFMEAHMIGEASPNTGFSEVALDYESIPQTVAAAKASDVMVVSNMVTDEVIYKILEDVEGGLAQPEYAVVPPEVLNTWKTRGRLVNWQGQETWRRDVQMPFFMTLTKALHDGGIPLLIGTDMSVEGMVPAHIHRDLELLVEAGLTPYEALEAGTKNAGISVERMGRDGSFGMVEIGRLANLILLEQNPLENVSHTRSRTGVMVRGQWFRQDELDQLVDDFVGTD